MDTKSIANELGALIEVKARELIADMEINVRVNGQIVDVDTRDDHMDSIDVYLNRESLDEAIAEIPDCDDVLTFGNTGCLRRVS